MVRKSVCVCGGGGGWIDCLVGVGVDGVPGVGFRESINPLARLTDPERRPPPTPTHTHTHPHVLTRKDDRLGGVHERGVVPHQKLRDDGDEHGEGHGRGDDHLRGMGGGCVGVEEKKRVGRTHPTRI